MHNWTRVEIGTDQRLALRLVNRIEEIQILHVHISKFITNLRTVYDSPQNFDIKILAFILTIKILRYKAMLYAAREIDTRRDNTHDTIMKIQEFQIYEQVSDL